MVKAVLVDYTGTTVMEGGDALGMTVKLVCENSDFESPKAFIDYWWRLVRQAEAACFAETFRTEDDILHDCISGLRKSHHLTADVAELERLTKIWWSSPPLFDDTREFFEKCPYPIYVVSNNGAQYVSAAMQLYDLHPAGIVSGEMARAYKPHREIFDKALAMAGCEADEVVHIGDSYNSDIVGAHNAGIDRTILVCRKQLQQYSDTVSVSGLAEALEQIKARENDI